MSAWAIGLTAAGGVTAYLLVGLLVWRGCALHWHYKFPTLHPTPEMEAADAFFGLIWPISLVVVPDITKAFWRKHKERKRDRHRQAEASDRDRGRAGTLATADHTHGSHAPGGALPAGSGWVHAVNGTITPAQVAAAYCLPQSILTGKPRGHGGHPAGSAAELSWMRGQGAKPLPTEQRTIPIVAWKQAHLSATPDGRGVQLGSIAMGGAHQPEATATCGKGSGHKAPDPHCGPPGCGFYALLSADQAPAASPYVQLEVELSGRVIEHERGFRAEKQRILSVAVDGQCRGFLCDNAPTRVVFPAERSQTDYVTISPGWGQVPNWKPPFVCCDEHVGEQGERAVTLDRLSKHLGVPVKWAS